MRSLWDSFRGLTQIIQGPWLAMGDYNSILTMEDRQNGAPEQDIETRDFKECKFDCGLTELVTVGREYTWTNNHVYSRIDRALSNCLGHYATNNTGTGDGATLLGSLSIMDKVW